MAMYRRNFLLTLGALAASGAPAHAREEIATIAGTLSQLTRPGNGDNRATYMPGGKSLLFVSSRSGRSQIWRMDLNGNLSLVRESKANDYGRVAPSADGARLCFSSDRDGENAIYVLDLSSGATSRISDPSYWSFGPTWSSRDLIAYFSKKGRQRHQHLDRASRWQRGETDHGSAGRKPTALVVAGWRHARAFGGQRHRRVSDLAFGGGRRQCARYHPAGKLAATVLES
jgi:WD40-like Beta Propeller Repeat